MRVLSVNSAADPFVLGEIVLPNVGLWDSNRGYNDTNGKTLGTQTIDTAKKNLILISFGQSNIYSEAPSAYTLTNPTKIDNFSIYDGAIYRYADPPVGCGWAYLGLGGSLPNPNQGHVTGRISDLFINAGTFDRVINVPIAIGGTTVADWATGLPAGRCAVTMARLKARGIQPGAGFTFGAIWGQGESDGGTSQANYQNRATIVFSGLLNNGFVGRIFVAQQTWAAGITNVNVSAAQAALVDNVNIFAGPNADSILAAGRQSDNTHFNDTGVATYASSWKTSMHASGIPY